MFRQPDRANEREGAGLVGTTRSETNVKPDRTNKREGACSLVLSVPQEVKPTLSQTERTSERVLAGLVGTTRSEIDVKPERTNEQVR